MRLILIKHFMYLESQYHMSSCQLNPMLQTYKAHQPDLKVTKTYQSLFSTDTFYFVRNAGQAKYLINTVVPGGRYASWACKAIKTAAFSFHFFFAHIFPICSKKLIIIVHISQATSLNCSKSSLISVTLIFYT